MLKLLASWTQFFVHQSKQNHCIPSFKDSPSTNLLPHLTVDLPSIPLLKQPSRNPSLHTSSLTSTISPPFALPLPYAILSTKSLHNRQTRMASKIASSVSLLLLVATTRPYTVFESVWREAMVVICERDQVVFRGLRSVRIWRRSSGGRSLIVSIVEACSVILVWFVCSMPAFHAFTSYMCMKSMGKCNWTF